MFDLVAQGLLYSRLRDDVHRNALVARAAIVGVERVEAGPDDGGEPHWEVLLSDIAERLPISRRQWPVVRAIVKP